MEFINTDIISFIPLAGGFLGGLFNLIAGNTSSGGIRNQMLNNPMIEKMGNYADQFTDFGSEYYQKAKDYLGSAFTQQAIDKASAGARASDANLSASGIDTSNSGFAQAMRNNIFQEFGNKAFDASKGALFDMWGAGQNIASNMYGKISDVYNSANSAAASQTSQNAANSGQMLQTIGTIAAGFFLSDARLKTDIKKIDNAKMFGYDVYEFKYKPGVLPSNVSKDFKYVGIMAQDVQKKQPDAVFVHSLTGDLMIDVDKIEKSYLSKEIN